MDADRGRRAWGRVVRVAIVQLLLSSIAVVMFPWVGIVLWLVAVNGLVAYLEVRILRRALRPPAGRPAGDPRWGWATDETDHDRVRRRRAAEGRAWQREQQQWSRERRLHRQIRRELRRAGRHARGRTVDR